jgi:hypothetical protein
VRERKLSTGCPIALDRMSNLAHQLIEVIALERSGIRHGDGHWHGFNPVDMTLVELHATWLVLHRKPAFELTHKGNEIPSRGQALAA